MNLLFIFLNIKLTIIGHVYNRSFAGCYSSIISWNIDVTTFLCSNLTIMFTLSSYKFGLILCTSKPGPSQDVATVYCVRLHNSLLKLEDFCFIMQLTLSNNYTNHVEFVCYLLIRICWNTKLDLFIT